MQADLPQRTPRTDDPQQTKDKSHKIYVMVQPMPAPGTAGTPYFTGQDVSQFIEQYERLCARYYVTGKEKHQGLLEYCDY